jgi:hypothetical protein
MHNHTEEKAAQTKAEAEAFPSVSLLVKVYTLGAIGSIVLGLSLPLDTAQVTVCLGLGWLLTSMSLVMSVFVDFPRDDTEEDEY